MRALPDIAEPIYDGRVHDWRLSKGLATRLIDKAHATVMRLDVRRVIAPARR